MNIEPLVEPKWVAAHLPDQSLRVFDCTILLAPTPDDPLRIESGRASTVAFSSEGAAVSLRVSWEVRQRRGTRCSGRRGL
jgi:hypothetical protein